jgi:hypothetical protein
MDTQSSSPQVNLENQERLAQAIEALNALEIEDTEGAYQQELHEAGCACACNPRSCG